jgi:adenosylmethionine---8-amino-7-oxononanoate aminotransferase
MKTVKNWSTHSAAFNGNFFLAGTGTGVGKTHWAADYIRRHGGWYWKPVQAGTEEETDTEKVKRISGKPEASFLKERFRLNMPASPHIAAEVEDISIRLEDFDLPSVSPLLIEGAGGVLVPLNKKDTLIDLIKHFNIPVVLVSGVYLGSINHTLLSLSLLKANGIAVSAVIFSGRRNSSSEQAIMQRFSDDVTDWYYWDWEKEATNALPDEPLSAIIHPFTRYQDKPPLYIVRGEGAYLIDKRDNRYLDACGSWWTNLYGHAPGFIHEVVSQQSSRLTHVLFGGVTHPPAEQLGAALLDFLNGDYQRLFFSDNGSTSVEVALKMAWQSAKIKGKPVKRFLAFQGSYHGDTFGAMSVGERDVFVEPYESLLFPVSFLPYPEKHAEEAIWDALKSVENWEEIAGLIFEPIIQGAGGMRFADNELMPKILAYLKMKGVSLIADEVMTGFGRTGTDFGYQQLGVVPDFLCLSKALTGGHLPLAVTLFTESVYEPFKHTSINRQFFHGHSYTANPLACSAALATLAHYRSSKGFDLLSATKSATEALYKCFKGHSALQNPRVKGTVFAAEVKTAFSGYFYDNPLREFLYHTPLEQGVLLRPLGNVVYTLPPYILKSSDWELIQNALENTFNQINDV